MNKLYRYKYWFSLSNLSDFIAEFNQDGKTDKSAWEFWNWLDKKSRPKRKRLIKGLNQNKRI